MRTYGISQVAANGGSAAATATATPSRINENASSSVISSPYTISRGTTFNVGQGAASTGGSGGGGVSGGGGGAWDGAGALLSSTLSFSSSPAPAQWAHIQGNEKKLQKMARQSLLHELWQEQQRTHEKAVDW